MPRTWGGRRKVEESANVQETEMGWGLHGGLGHCLKLWTGTSAGTQLGTSDGFLPD